MDQKYYNCNLHDPEKFLGSQGPPGPPLMQMLMKWPNLLITEDVWHQSSENVSFVPSSRSLELDHVFCLGYLWKLLDLIDPCRIPYIFKKEFWKPGCYGYKKSVAKVRMWTTGAVSSRVQRVHLHPLRFSNGCNAPVLKVVKKEDESIFMQNSDFYVFWSCVSRQWMGHNY